MFQPLKPFWCLALATATAWAGVSPLSGRSCCRAAEQAEPGAASTAATASALPEVDQVRNLVQKYFSALPGWRPGHIVTVTEAEPLMTQLVAAGLPANEIKPLLKRFPTNSDFLVKELRTPAGRRFMSGMAGVKSGYDRLQRMSELPNGRRTVSSLIRNPRGAQTVAYLADDPKGIAASRLMGTKSVGKDFAKSTGKIYTAEELLERLEGMLKKPEEQGGQRRP